MSQYDVAVIGGGPVGAGSAAAIALNGDLVEDDVRHAVHDFEQGLSLTLTAHTHQKETS